MPLLHKVFLISVVSMIFKYQAQAEVNLNCTSKIGGSWNFGTAPAACNVSPLMTQDSVRSQYGPLFFNESQDASTERRNFLSEMFPLLRDVATAYILRQNPRVSPAELSGFLDGVYALAHQETYWTHYRDGKDQVVRYMRGDSDHGHGMMQVDDRSHVAALREGRGVDLVYNIVYGLDIYYKAWVKSATASCVSSETNYKSRARASWAAYNGGSSKLCRWTSNTTGDKQYLAKFDQRAWLNYVTDTQAPVQVDVNCLIYNQRPCALPGESLPPPSTPPQDPQVHELVGKTLTIVAPNGINLRDLQTNKVLILVPKGQQVVVEDVTQKDSDIKTYLKVTYAGRTGSIYGGHEKPNDTRQDWIRVENKENPTVKTAVLASQLPYKLLRECAGYACVKTSVAVKGGESPDTLEILNKNNEGWVQVQMAGIGSGWIEQSEIREINQ
jgi:uncharacterized protein YgiM (DUF1202 family)